MQTAIGDLERAHGEAAIRFRQAKLGGHTGDTNYWAGYQQAIVDIFNDTLIKPGGSE